MEQSQSSLHISVLQMALEWEAPEANYRQAESLLKESVTETDMIVLPEMFSTGFSMKPDHIAEPMHGPTMYWMRKLAGHYDALVMGSMIIEEEGKYFNRFLAVDGFGLVYHYDKIRLFSMSGENVAYTAGSSVEAFEWKKWRFLPQVCYDLRFPENVRQADPQHGHAYDVLVYVANWPSARVAHWDTLLRARAIENQSYVIGANRVGEDQNQYSYIGHSAIIDPKGNVLGTSEKQGVIQHVIEAEPMHTYRQSFPAWRDAS
ncbi:MAG: amidohydrolase [Bacteroidia bacterium]